MKYTDNAINIVAAKAVKGVGRGWINRNLRGNESIDTIVSLLNKDLGKDNFVNFDQFCTIRDNVVLQLQILEESCDGLVAIGDKNFPKIRGTIKEGDRPVFLFYKGDISLLDVNNCKITVIGLLNPDETIEIREKKIVAEIVRRGVTIVSGLAFGCDSIAHRQALIGGKTVAVLPSALNNIMPAKNKGLAFEIVEGGGLLVTEYHDKQKSGMDLSGRYKDRDRLQALFCDTIILTASYAQDSGSRWSIIDQKLDSGSRLAMGYAKEYYIPRAVMYDENFDSNNPMFDLNRQLIRENKDVTVLTQKNLQHIIDRIESRKSTDLGDTGNQVQLF
jgi:DNA processing protein